MTFSVIRHCCGIEYGLARTGNWVLITPLPAAAPARKWPALFLPEESRIVRNQYKPNRDEQIAAIEAMLHRHFGHESNPISSQP